MDWFTILTRAFWCGCAAAGFGILFNAPTRSLIPIWIGGCVAGLIKFTALSPGIGMGVIISSFLAASAAGLVGIPTSRWRDVPLVIVTIPSIIPLVPGVFAYRAMMGLMKLSRHTSVDYSTVIADTVYNGVLALFVMVAITFGIAIPLFLFGVRLRKAFGLTVK